MVVAAAFTPAMAPLQVALSLVVEEKLSTGVSTHDGLLEALEKWSWWLQGSAWSVHARAIVIAPTAQPETRIFHHQLDVVGCARASRGGWFARYAGSACSAWW